MASFHFEVECISRKQGRSVIRAANYQSGERLRDNYYGKTYYRQRDDVLHSEILLPSYAPREFYDRQTLWNEVDKAEKRSDSRTARKIIASLPNELSLAEQIELVRHYVNKNLISIGMCADIAIHEVKNESDQSRNNPHVHILLTDRPVTSKGFSDVKDRTWNNRSNIRLWREQWALIQNRAYERKGLTVRVSDKSFIERGIKNREPLKYLHRGDMYLERKGIHTDRGDENREIKKRNAENERRELERQRERERDRLKGRTR